MKLDEIDKDKFCDEFWSEFTKLVPEHLRPRLSVMHIRFMIDAFFTVLERQEDDR